MCNIIHQAYTYVLYWNLHDRSSICNVITMSTLFICNISSFELQSVFHLHVLIDWIEFIFPLFTWWIRPANAAALNCCVQAVYMLCIVIYSQIRYNHCIIGLPHQSTKTTNLNRYIENNVRYFQIAIILLTIRNSTSRPHYVYFKLFKRPMCFPWYYRLFILNFFIFSLIKGTGPG